MTKMKPAVCSALAAILALAFAACAATPAAPAPEPSPLEELSRAIRDVSHHLNSNIPAERMIAFVNVQSESAELSNFIIDDLIANAVTDRVFTVVDRQRLDYIRAEQNIQLSGEVDDETARSIGSFLGAHTIVSGRVSAFGGHFRLTIRALDVETAEVQGQYNRIIGTERAMAALIGTGRGQAAQAPTTQVARPPAAQSLAAQAAQALAAQAVLPQPAPAAPAAPAVTAIEVTARSAGTLFFQDREIATLWDGETYSIPVNGPGTFELRFVMADHTATRTISITMRGVTRVSFGGVYTVGQRGPAGGIVFFDKGSYSDGWRFLEAAPASTEFTAPWGSVDVSGTSTALGFGRSNTQAIVRALSNAGLVGQAAQVADSLVYGGFNDWFLPSSDELDWMFRNLRERGLGGFANADYWSSSQSASNSRTVWNQDFNNGNRTEPLSFGRGAKNRTLHVRAIRAF